MTPENWGTLATAASLVIVGIGLPHQIYKNFRRKTCEGLAPSLIISAAISYTLWCIYGWTKPDLFLKIAQTPGCALALILLIQLIYYRKGRGQ
jgi:uncharacterized protein with PQ loop repeat